MPESLMLLAAGFVASAMNAVAGGGSFISLPVLVAVGLPSTVANASSSVALVSGGLTSAWAVRKDLVDVGPFKLKTLTIVSAMGGLVGAILLVVTPTRMFDIVLPWLLLLATTMLAFGARLRDLLARRDLHVGPRLGLTLQFLVAVYGGYFGGALGLIMLAVWTLFTEQTPKTVMPSRLLTGSAANVAGIGCFILAGFIAWRETLWMLAGSVGGGYLGARVGRRLPAGLVRALVLTVTVVTTAVFFWRAYR